MKLAITGHTRGIGKALFDYYSANGHEVRGYSRSNGFHLPHDYMNVITNAKDCDVFINNAYSRDTQALILAQLCGHDWRGQNKHIVNLSSVAAMMPIHKKVMYAAHKAALVRVVENYQSQQVLPHISNLSLGLVDTPGTAMIANPNKMSVNDVIALVEFCLKFPHTILDITVRHKDSVHPITY